jgi:hypothetical protein
MTLVDWIIKKWLTGQFNRRKEMLQQKKFYIVAITGILTTLCGMLFGPVDLGNGMVIPQIPTAEGMTLVWGTIMLIYKKMGQNRIENEVKKLNEASQK